MPAKTSVRPRKEPRQERSRRMNERLLQAAARVLERRGPIAFSTNEVARVARVSVGSLYQYYPNKAAMLFRLHERETAETWAALDAILSSSELAARERVTRTVHAFFESEAQEATLRGSLRGAEIHFRDTPEFKNLESRIVARLCAFLREVLPPRSRDIEFKARFVSTLVSSLAERVTTDAPEHSDVRKWSTTCSELLCGYLGL